MAFEYMSDIKKVDTVVCCKYEHAFEMALRGNEVIFQPGIGKLEKNDWLKMRPVLFDLGKSIEIMRTNKHSGGTITYAIAQAIIEGFDRIILYGVEVWEYYGKLAYGFQIKNIGEWIQAAENRGIEVLIPGGVVTKILEPMKIG